VGATVQARLREASHSCHARINQHPLLAGLMGRDYPLTSYQTVLLAYYNLYEMLELKIQDYVIKYSIPFDYSTRQKLFWLYDDLRFFDLYSNLEVNVASPGDAPRIESIGELIGMLYPLEGATLGGQLISKQLFKNHNLTRSEGARFFNGYADDTMAYWNEFCLFANSINDDETQCKLAENAAILTFNRFEEALNVAHDAHR